MRVMSAVNTAPDPWWLRLFTMLGLGLLAYLNAAIAPQQAGVITSLWYVNAIAVVILLYHPLCLRMLLLASYQIGLSAGYSTYHLAAITHLTLMLANLAEICLAVYLLERHQSVRTFYLSLPAAWRLGVFGILLPPLAGSIFAVSGALLDASTGWSETGIAWYINSVICNASVLPLLLLIKHRRWQKNNYWSLGFQLLLLLIYVAVILKYFPFPFVYLGLGLTLLALKNGVFGAALAGFLTSFCIALLIQIDWFTWPQYNQHLLMIFVYLPILIALIPPLLLAIFVDTGRNSEARERELFNRYLLAAEAGQVGVWEWRPATHLMTWDERMFDLYEIDRHRIVPSFSVWKSCVHPDDLPRLQAEIEHALNETNVLDSEFRIVHSDESIHYLRTHAMVERDATGNVWRMVGTNWDITELRVLMNDLSREKELLRTTLLSIGEAVVMTDQWVNVVFLNPAAEKILRCSNAWANLQPIDHVMHIVDEDGHEIENPLHAALQQRQLMNLCDNAYLKLSDGSSVAIQDSAAPILSNTQQLLGGVLVFTDVTEMRGLQKRLGYQASHDPLTGLINRSAFETILQDVIKESVMTAGQSALVFLDLDYFKRINDSAGHAAGDALLRQLAELMSDHMRASDIVARLGGDEFGLIMRNCSVVNAGSFMQKLIAEICRYEFNWDGQIFHVGASAGVVAINGQYMAFNEFMVRADQACYAAKKAGRGQVKMVE